MTPPSCRQPLLRHERMTGDHLPVWKMKYVSRFGRRCLAITHRNWEEEWQAAISKWADVTHGLKEAEILSDFSPTLYNTIKSIIKNFPLEDRGSTLGQNMNIAQPSVNLLIF